MSHEDVQGASAQAKPIHQCVLINDTGHHYSVELRAVASVPYALCASLKAHIPACIRDSKPPIQRYLVAPDDGEQLRQWADHIDHQGYAEVKRRTEVLNAMDGWVM